MEISIIAAIAKNNAIGKDNQLLWHMPADMAFFKEKTTGHCVLTGRKNYESIPEKFRPLKDRTNIIVTHSKKYNALGTYVVHSIEEGIEFAKLKKETELFIIGGGQIYMESMIRNLATTLYITHIDEIFEADVFFPSINPMKWRKTMSQMCSADEKHKYNYEFAVYKRG